MSSRSVFLTGSFWQGTLERALSTGVQAVLLAYGAEQLNVLTLDWKVVAGTFAGGALLSILKALAAGAISQGPGFGTAEVVADRVVAQETKSGLVVAGDASPITTGTPVDVEANGAVGVPDEQDLHLDD